MKRQIIFSILGALMVVSFQNCSKAQFSTVDGQLVEKTSTLGELASDANEDGIPDDQPPVIDDEETVPPVADEEEEVTPPVDMPPGKGKPPVVTDKDPVPPGKKPVADDDDARIYVCVLEGPGKSIKVAYQNNLLGKVATPDDVCMSRNACLNIISQVFDVKEPAKRGFCPNKNPHVVSMSDAQLQTLVDQLKPAPVQ